jgi:pyruvate ferredoxin oxidoreductase gamma subunit
MFRIRLHGRGGQGIKTAGQILGSAFFLAGFEVQDAPRYGAERRGAPVLAGVRAAKATIDERGPIAQPDLIVVADSTLFRVPFAEVLHGAGANTILLVLGTESAITWRERLGFAGTVLICEPDDHAEYPAIPLVGAAARMTGVIGPGNLDEALRAELTLMSPLRVKLEQKRAMRAFHAFAPHEGTVRESPFLSARNYVSPEWIDIPLEAAKVAAPDIRAVANSNRSQTGFWRVQRPVIDYDRCNRCSWICSTLCPDSAITVGADRAPAIDYDHCKGCLVCVTVCPPHAIAAVPEQSEQTVVAPEKTP